MALVPNFLAASMADKLMHKLRRPQQVQVELDTGAYVSPLLCSDFSLNKLAAGQTWPGKAY